MQPLIHFLARVAAMQCNPQYTCVVLFDSSHHAHLCRLRVARVAVQEARQRVGRLGARAAFVGGIARQGRQLGPLPCKGVEGPKTGEDLAGQVGSIGASPATCNGMG